MLPELWVRKIFPCLQGVALFAKPGALDDRAADFDDNTSSKSSGDKGGDGVEGAMIRALAGVGSGQKGGAGGEACVSMSAIMSQLALLPGELDLHLPKNTPSLI